MSQKKPEPQVQKALRFADDFSMGGVSLRQVMLKANVHETNYPDYGKMEAAYFAAFPQSRKYVPTKK